VSLFILRRVSSTLTTRILKVPLRWLAAGVGAVFLGASALFHGLAPVPSPPPATIRPGTAIDAGPIRVTIVDAVVLSSQDGLDTDKPGDRWFGVVATVEVTGKDSFNDVSWILRVPHVAGLTSVEPQSELLVRDATVMSYLNPGMPERVAFLWEQSSSVPVPAVVDVDVFAETLTPDSLNGDTPTWLDPALQAVVRATVKDQRT
jgi:hypothetical protein